MQFYDTAGHSYCLHLRDGERLLHTCTCINVILYERKFSLTAVLQTSVTTHGNFTVWAPLGGTGLYTCTTAARQIIMYTEVIISCTCVCLF